MKTRVNFRYEIPGGEMVEVIGAYLDDDWLIPKHFTYIHEGCKLAIPSWRIVDAWVYEEDE